MIKERLITKKAIMAYLSKFKNCKWDCITERFGDKAWQTYTINGKPVLLLEHILKQLPQVFALS